MGNQISGLITDTILGVVFGGLILIVIAEVRRLTGEFPSERPTKTESLKTEVSFKCPVVETRKESLALELKILRNLANHYAENGYSKAIKALKEIEDSKDKSRK